MSETEVLNGLQIKRRELENELASLAQTEKLLRNDLKTLEEKIIRQLEADIQAKKVALNGLEAKKGELEKKLNDLQGTPADSQVRESQSANSENEVMVQESSAEENNTEVTVVECQTEQDEALVRTSEADRNNTW